MLKVKVKVAPSCLTFRNPMDFSVHGILQARILEWVPISFSRGSSPPRGRTHVSCIGRRFFFTTEPTEKPVFPLTFSISAIALRRSCLTGVLLPGTEWVTSGEKPSHPRPTQPRLDQPGWPWDTWARQMLVFLLLSLGGSLLCNNIWTLEVMCSICSGQISFLATRGC